MNNDPKNLDPEPIHGFFGVSYAHHLVLPRSVLQSMPQEWQARFVACLEELDDTIDWRPSEGGWWVTFKDKKGKFRPDPLNDYERGRRRLPLRSETREIIDDLESR